MSDMLLWGSCPCVLLCCFLIIHCLYGDVCQSGSILQGGAISLPKHSTSGLSCARVLAAHTLPFCLWVHIVERVVAMIPTSGISMWLSRLTSSVRTLEGVTSRSQLFRTLIRRTGVSLFPVQLNWECSRVSETLFPVILQSI